MILKDLENISPENKLQFILKNKEAIIKAKRSMTKSGSIINFTPQIVKDVANKNEGNSNTFEIIGNAIGFLDGHDDVSLRGSFTKTVNENGKNIPILINHDHTPRAIFARNLGVEVKDMPITELGYNAQGMTEVVAAKISPDYDEDMRRKYQDGVIKQHSVGIQYVKLELAVNDPCENREYENWQKYIGQVINRDEAERKGYFFGVVEQKLFEISAVVFGSNPYTPSKNNSLDVDPPKQSKNQPSVNLVEMYKTL